MTYIRLHITAERQTEERFVKKILTPHLADRGIYTDVRCVLTSRDKRTGREYRGGFRRRSAYEKDRFDITTWLKEDNNPECRFTTMFDLYALPVDFPGYREAEKERDPYRRVFTLEKALTTDIDDSRFFSYIQLHEFETLILADPDKLAQEYLEYGSQIQGLIQMMVDKNPELINDGQNTVPSKRILKAIPEYDKVNSGPIVVEDIGLDHLKERCRHFREWVEKLENLAGD